MKKTHAKKCESHIHSNPDLIRDRCACDGYHTFDELYDHRITLYIALCKKLNGLVPVWKSKRHSDGEICFGTGTQFVLGMFYTEGDQITYHIPIERWDEYNFAEEFEKATEFDGHTSEDVLERISKL